MNWLPWPLIPKRQWPVLRFKEKRALTRAEHELILSRETNEQMRAFLHCCWHIGGSQSDVANLKAEDIDWRTQVISFFRAKTRAAQIIRFGAELAGVLRGLPASGPLFPRLALINERHRSSLFQRSCARVGVVGVSLYSYRYAWAAGQVRGLSGAVRPGSAGSQQPGRASGLRAQGAGHPATAGGLRARIRAEGGAAQHGVPGGPGSRRATGGGNGLTLSGFLDELVKSDNMIL
jgi:integrase